MKRFIPPKIGDTKRIRPLVNADRITIEAAEGKDKGYYCLPLFNYNSQEVEVYFASDFENGILGKLYELIEDEEFSLYNITIETVGAPEKVGLSYIEGKGILTIKNIVKAKWPVTRHELPTKLEIQNAVDSYENQKANWKNQDWKNKQSSY
jgi:hypothetical protein